MSPTPSRRDGYWARINRAVDYIEAHLADDLRLDDIASAAHFSPFHFHRIFSALMGETVSQFVQRVRLERAATLLRSHPRRPVIRIAMECGYSNPAAFSRAFRGAFGTSPTAWRRRGSQSSKASTVPGKDGKEGGAPDDHRSGERQDERTPEARRHTMSKLALDVRVEDLPETPLAYIRHVGPYAGDENLFGQLFSRLFQWAGPRGLVGPESQTVSVYHDNPEITDEEKLRVSVGLTVPADTEVSGEVGKMTLPAGTCAIARFEIDASQYGDAWQAVYGDWLPESGFEADDRPTFERYLNDPREHPEGKHIVEICVPVRPA